MEFDPKEAILHHEEGVDLIPVQPQYYAADGFMKLLKVVKGIHQRLNPDLQIERMQCKGKIKPKLYLCCFIKKGKQ